MIAKYRLRINFGIGDNLFMRHHQADQKGVTLIELLVATSVLALIVIALATTGVSIMQTQNRANALQGLQDDLRFSLEVAGKEIRLSQVSKDAQDTNCVPEGDSFVYTNSSLRFINDRDECVRYQYDATNQTLCRDVDSNLDDGVSFPASCTSIISNKTKITDLRFTVTGQDQAGQQPRITVTLNSQSSVRSDITLSLQTTVTQRELDVFKK